MKICGWGRYPIIESAVTGVRCAGDVSRALSECRSLIGRGNGRSYGDAALNSERILSLLPSDRFINFDAESGRVECEAGLLLADLLAFTVPRGWFPPVVPGTKQVTIGGMIAADVHGKNHHRLGTIGKHVESLRLCLSEGEVVTCSRQSNAELFEATLGGMGLSGIILSANIKLLPVMSAHIRQQVIKTPNLDETMRLFSEQDESTYTVAWIDCLANGTAKGRSLFFCGEHAAIQDLPKDMQTAPFTFRRRQTFAVPFDAPSWLLNASSIRLFNTLYYHRTRPAERIIDYDRFFFPLDALGDWNRLYGANGLLQYQCLLPTDEAAEGLRRILDITAGEQRGSFLAVLKRLGPGGRFLSFPKEGYTMTLDFPESPATAKTLSQLDDVLRDFGGRVYLAKDARAPRDLVEKGYPDIEKFRELRRRIDPQRKLRSLLSERLGL